MAVTWGDAQAAVIGAALIEPKCVPEILADMRPEDFDGAYLRFFEAFRDLIAEQRPIDPVVVLARIGAEYKDLTRDLIQQTPTAANFRAYVRICKEQSRLRQLRELGLQLSGAVSLEDARTLARKTAELSIERPTRKRRTAMEIAADWISRMNAEEKPEYITCGFGCLDSLIHTVPGNYHVIAGYTSHGKSALALQVAMHIAQTRSVGYFSLEMPERDFSDRLITISSGVEQERVRSMDLTPEDLTETARGASKLFDLKERIAYEPASGFTVEEIRARTIQRGYEVIFVDYLQNVVPEKSNYDRFRGVTEISRGLQELAQTLGVVVFAMSQVSRPSDEEHFLEVPALSQLRESGQIEQDADAVVIVHAPLRRQCPEFRVLDVAKNRTGPIDRFFIRFDGARQSFSAPSLTDYRIWSEMMKKRRLLNSEERKLIEIEAEKKTAAALGREQKKRYQREKSGDQVGMEELP